ncbi:MAG: DJ-1/PfpI family protein [Methylobacteriaceae bacterium]|nr:DJ-1/PfpI family protein [Methylobacteriaceae bacterium]
MKIAMPVYDQADMLDVAGPCEMFYYADIAVDLLAPDPSVEFTFNGGFPFRATQSFANAGTYDALWIPGGAPQALADIINDTKRTYLNFITDTASKVRFVCSVCEGAMLLAAAGLLDGYTATTHWAFIPCFTQHFPKVSVADGHPRYVLDRNRLTGAGISAGLDEALMLIQLLAGTAAAMAAQQTTQYYPQPPVVSEIPRAGGCPLPPLHLPPHGG